LILIALSFWRKGSVAYAVRVSVLLSVIGLAGLLMATLKWWPVLTTADAESLGGRAGATAILPPLFATFALPYDKSFLPGDLTMRSLWLPGPILASMLLVRRFSFGACLGLGLIALAVLLGGLAPALGPPFSALPGLQVSRFPISDWRPVLHVGIVVLGCEGWRGLIAHEPSTQRSTLAIALGALAVLVMLSAALGLGYSPGEIIRPALTISGVLLGAGLAAALAERRQWGRFALPVALLAFGITSAVEGATFHQSQARTWRFPWSEARERELFGTQIAAGTGDRDAIQLERRPPRVVFGTTPAEAASQRLEPRYNGCWYKGTFCLLGYNNIRLSRPNNEWFRHLQDPREGPSLLAFSQRAQQIVVLPAGATFDPTLLGRPEDTSSPVISLLDGATGRILGYARERVTYEITTKEPATVVENEGWASGWSVRLCNAQGCSADVDARPTPQHLRSFDVPPGRWEVTLTYGRDLYRVPWTLFAIGVILAALTPFLVKLVGSGCALDAPNEADSRQI
jgi:hypothetical protein